MTVGPWKDVNVDSYNVRLSDVRIDTTLSGGKYDQASLKVQIQYTGSPSDDYRVEYALKDAQGKVIRSDALAGKENLDYKFSNGEVEAWYPIGHGKQPLYSLSVQLKDSVR
jgi:beta-mannosidase